MDTLIQRLYYKLRDLASKPDERGRRSGGYWHGKVRDKAVWLTRYATGRLLEIGCGEGMFLSAFVAHNHQAEVWGLDANEELLEKVRSEFPPAGADRIHLVKGLAQNCPFENNFFDVVVAINLFMCLATIQEARAVVTEAARVLKPGGRFILEFRNKANPVLRGKYKLARLYDGTLKGNPLSTYRIDEMKAILMPAGFDVEAEYDMESPIKRLAPIVMLEAKKRA